jgi:hypothetical protein
VPGSDLRWPRQVRGAYRSRFGVCSGARGERRR